MIKNKIILIGVIFLFENGLSQNSTELKLSTYPAKNNYWWLNNNNSGKELINSEIEFKWKNKFGNNEVQITLSNSFQDNNYTINEKGYIIDKSSQGKEIAFGESFIKYSFSDNTFLRAGLYYRDFSKYLDDDLSSGSILISKNARPMPKVGLVHQQNFTKNLFLDAGIAHGFFDKNNYYSNKAPFLHEKFIYLNFINEKNHFSMGFVHEAMWAGATERDGSFPRSIKDYFKIVISADGEPIEGSPHANAMGSHLGIWDFFYQKNFDSKKLKLYYQHIFEDTSSLRFANKIDGLWGLELENFIAKHNILFEYLSTAHAYDNPPYQGDRYYWNHQYRAGWSYKGNIIGNPHINSRRTDDTNLLKFKDLTKLLHLGIKSENKYFTYSIKAFRRINNHERIKYLASFEKLINKNIALNFIVFNGDDNSLGFSLSYFY
tara:strand:- start:139 stop:1437 length:1299 start_codon:yes stop_codon:yes gene_type:complete